MQISRFNSRLVVLLGLLGLGAGSVSGCVKDLAPRDGVCVVATPEQVDCSVDVLGATIQDRANVPPLKAYACSGTLRPDDSPTIQEGVPAGKVCTALGSVAGDASKVGYCCTDYDTTCAYNPVADCTSDKYGFQCRGSQRPETFNPTLFCDQATLDGDHLNYCCHNTTDMSGSCVATAGCNSLNLSAWTCKNPEDIPRSQELLASKSRADTFYMTCSMPSMNPNGSLFYCCMTTGIIAEGGTCNPHYGVEGCASGRFGWSCLGPDTPADDYPVMHCPDPGVKGISMEGYDATLYCCDFVAPDSAATGTSE